ncbi:cation transporter [Christiangramia fulva]|uniref:Cation transporter n=1 Tax=Christiangramia fulva TaxID=2126553 RepID=A0A2R3Z220_9FLAO|nr:efflux RND transporter permease subunit [Christiangramia fulva]AVR44296.1 cation transporter [Christiangramia fulva]
MLNKIIRFFLENKLITVLTLFIFIVWGIVTAPFNWDTGIIPRDRVPVDAIPDLGENQQIVFTEWMGRSPQDVEDQITYPLTTALLGVPGVKTIRSNSIFGLSVIYIIFEEDVEFYWSRSRVLEKLNSLPQGTIPDAVQPALGPDATALGQVYWYTLEGRNPKTGEPNGGWDPQELRSIQDFYVGYGLTAAGGVSEVSPIGGFVKEYQVDIDPDAMKANNVNVAQIMKAVKQSNLDIGARTIEFNKAEYIVRSLGYIKDLDDLRESVVAVKDNTPIRIKDVARVSYGPATRRGGLDKSGSEAVGGVVVARYGSNPMQVIENVKKKIEEISPGLPSKTLKDGTVSKVTIVPFYDRSGLINETLGTLESALSHEVLISILVVLILVMNLRASIIISSLLPVGVLMTFIVMRYAGIPANVVALSGIAIAIGVMVDVGIIFTENIIRHLEMPNNIGARGKRLLELVYESTVEVASAVMTALATTVISFLPVFAMQAAEGKLFRPLAFTKTFALLAALLLGLIIIPSFAYWIFSVKFGKKKSQKIWNIALIVIGLYIMIFHVVWAGLVFIAIAANNLAKDYLKPEHKKYSGWITLGIAVVTVTYFLAIEWLPLGAAHSGVLNFIFVVFVLALILGTLLLVVHYYSPILRWCLANKWKFLAIPIVVFFIGMMSWKGFDGIFGFVADGGNAVGIQLRQTSFWQSASKRFPGLGEEFMPPLDEGSFLLMPTTMPHSGVEENREVISLLDQRVNSIPEVKMVVGKWGRAKSALDPAPISMYENIIQYVPEYALDEDGHRQRFKVNDDEEFMLKGGGTFAPGKDNLAGFDTEKLIPDADGEYFRQWRPEIKNTDDIWNEIVQTTQNIPGLTSAPKLQPIQTRLIMLQTGMRAPMGLKVFGPDLETIERVGLDLEKVLQEVPSVKSSSVFADRVVGKPYLEIDIDRKAIARYGLSIEDMQMFIGSAVGGNTLTTTVEGRERYPVRVRYAREYRDNPEDVKDILIPTPVGTQVPLEELADITYRQGPQSIKSEDTFLDSYVIFDKNDGYSEVKVVEQAKRFIQAKIDSGELNIPPSVNFKFAGNYENQIRATKRLSIVIPISLIMILLILYFQFGNLQTTFMVFSGVFVAFSGGFIMLWLYGQEWFLNFSVFGENMRDIFQMGTVNLSVAVWVGFIALFGIATDDGVIMGTYLKQVFDKERPDSISEIRTSVLHAGQQRVRPAMMTASVAVIALLPVLTSTGKGADIMIPMAIPSFGGMLIQVMTMFIVPVLYSMWQEKKWKKSNNNPRIDETK